MRIKLTVAVAMLMHILTAQNNDMRLMRFPAMYGQSVVFSYAGDMYTVNRDGGVARRLTSDHGLEIYPRFSPDGLSIAFTAQYDGNTEIYKMPAEGGTPVRLTYTATLGRDDVSDRMGPNNICMAWRDDKQIVYRSRKQSYNDFVGQLFYANVNGGLSQQVPVPAGGNCSFSPDKKRMAYNRIFREFRTWKYYQGGMADDIWIYNFDTKKTENITNHKAQDIFPMWVGERIYFCSDRDRTMNIFCYETATHTVRKVTNFTDYDVKWPSLGTDGIVYERGGHLYYIDFVSEVPKKITVTINEDFAIGRDEWVDATKTIGYWSFSPDGNRALFAARGDIFSVPAKSGITRNFTTTSSANDRSPAWSPDGKWIAYISDKTGEDEIYMQAADGLTPPKQLTKNADTYKYFIIWSPDNSKIAWCDQKKRLNIVDVNTQDMTVVATSKTQEINDFAWSSNSKWIAFSDRLPAHMDQIFLYELASQKYTAITTESYSSYSPAFSNDGKYLLFVSDRDFNPIYSSTEWNHAYADMSRIYMITLSKDTPHPFALKNDLVKSKEAEKPAAEKENKDKEKPKEEKKESKVDLDGMQQRITVLPADVSNYFGLACIDNSIYYAKRGRNDNATMLKHFDIKEKKETELGEIDGYEISADEKKMMISKKGAYYIIDLPKGKFELKDAMNMSDVRVLVNRKQEWKQIFDECWRQMRDFFYDPNMHGVDWKAMHTMYNAYLPYVNHRTDLTYVIGEMIGELNVGHAYVGGGDYPKAERITQGLLGAELVRGENGFYQIKKILQGENWYSSSRSPLTEIGVNATEGMYIVTVNGVATNTMNDIYASLVNTAGKQVELGLNNAPSISGARNALVSPISNEAPLYYYNWVEKNAARVNAATNGQVGYIHIPDMGVNGLNEFVKHFYPQLHKKALIIDDRGNGGGNVSPMIIERLNRELAMISVQRNVAPYTNPFQMMNGPKVMLINEYSASDGDLFPYRFKKYGMGKVIGKRSWGGVVGIRGSLNIMDGGYLNRPEFAPYDTEGKSWIIEGYGVDPDIVIDNDPATEYAGTDQQLEKAIEEIMEQLKQAKEMPAPPPYPQKNK